MVQQYKDEIETNPVIRLKIDAMWEDDKGVQGHQPELSDSVKLFLNSQRWFGAKL